MNERLIIVLIFSALFVRELWLLLPYSDTLINPFRFYQTQGITLQSYVYFGCHYASMLIIAYTFQECLSKLRVIAQVWFALQFVEFVDYFLTYNTTWFYLGSIGVGITLIKFAVLFTLTIYKIWKI